MTPALHLPQKETQRRRLHPAEQPAHGRAEVLCRGCSLLACHQDMSLRVGRNPSS